MLLVLAVALMGLVGSRGAWLAAAGALAALSIPLLPENRA